MGTYLNLLDARKFFSDTIAREGRMVTACGNGLCTKLFSKIPPPLQGVSPEGHDANLVELAKVQRSLRCLVSQ